MGSLLLRDGLLTAQELEQALTEKDANGHRLGEIVVGHGWVAAATVASPDEVRRVTGDRLG